MESDRKKIIELIKKEYNITITDIAKKIGIKRSEVYSFIKKGKSGIEILLQLENQFPKSFPSKPHQAELFTGENKDMMNKSAEIKTTVSKEKGNTFVTPSKFLRMVNLRCKNDCYFMKVAKRDFERLRPNCPSCGKSMHTRVERKKMGLEF